MSEFDPCVSLAYFRDAHANSPVPKAWYGGGQLSAPACGGKAPSDNDMVVAVKSGGPFKCHDTVHIHYNGKMQAAKVVDYCAGCDEHALDLTQGLFRQLAGSLDKGVMKGVHVRLIPN